MRDVLVRDRVQIPRPGDQHPVGDLGPGCAHPCAAPNSFIVAELVLRAPGLPDRDLRVMERYRRQETRSPLRKPNIPLFGLNPARSAASAHTATTMSGINAPSAKTFWRQQ